MVIKQVRPAAAHEWDQAHEASKAASIFHSRAWAEFWSDLSEGRRSPAAKHITFSDNRTAIIPLVRSRRFGGTVDVYESSVEGTYGGWISAHPLSSAQAQALRNLLHREKNLEWLSNPYDHAQMSNPEAATTCTWAFNLTEKEPDLEQRWKSHKATTLRKVRRAEKAGLRLRRLERSDIDSFYSLYLDCQRRWRGGSSFYSQEVFRRIFGLEGTAFWGVFHPDGQMVSGNVIFSSHGHAVCWAAVAKTEALALRPYEYLYVNQVLHYRSSGFHWFDLNPSGGHAGVDEFKRRLGADPIPCEAVQRSSARHRLLERTWGALRRATARNKFFMQALIQRKSEWPSTGEWGRSPG